MSYISHADLVIRFEQVQENAINYGLKQWEHYELKMAYGGYLIVDTIRIEDVPLSRSRPFGDREMTKSEMLCLINGYDHALTDQQNRFREY